MWYTQSDGLAMGASLAVILANLWMKSFEKSLQKPKKGREIKTTDTKVICIDCNRRVTFQGKGVECESCKKWFHAKCQGITETEYQTMQEFLRICSYCSEKGRKEDTLELKLFKSYVDDIVCTVMGNSLDCCCCCDFSASSRGDCSNKFWSWFNYFLQSEQSQKKVHVHTTLSLKSNIRRSHMKDRIRLSNPKGWEKFISSGRLLATLAVRK